MRPNVWVSGEKTKRGQSTPYRKSKRYRPITGVIGRLYRYHDLGQVVSALTTMGYTHIIYKPHKTYDDLLIIGESTHILFEHFRNTPEMNDWTTVESDQNVLFAFKSSTDAVRAGLIL